MAEFKDISLFEEVTPTYANAANMWVQVSATEKVSLQSVINQAITGPLTGFTNPAGASALTASDTLLSAIRKLTGTTLNTPYRIVRQGGNEPLMAIAFENIAVLILRHSVGYTVPQTRIKIINNPTYSIASDSDSTIIANLASSEGVVIPIGYGHIETQATTLEVPSSAIVEGMNMNVTAIDLTNSDYDWTLDSPSSIIVLSNNLSEIPTFGEVPDIQIHKCKGWDDIFNEKGGYPVITLHYMYTIYEVKHIFANVAKYQ